MLEIESDNEYYVIAIKATNLIQFWFMFDDWLKNCSIDGAPECNSLSIISKEIAREIFIDCDTDYVYEYGQFMCQRGHMSHKGRWWWFLMTQHLTGGIVLQFCDIQALNTMRNNWETESNKPRL